MPLLDIAISHSSFQNCLGCCRGQVFINDRTPNYSPIQHEERWQSFRKSFQNTRNLNFTLNHFNKSCRLFLVNAVATLEPKSLVQSKDGEKEANVLASTAESVSAAIENESSSGDSEEVDEREKLRRLRISKANKGNTPWNKGRKHSAETLRRIKERTRLAMQSPKVKMKLANLGHAQSTETREKIAIGVRMGWQKRREMLKLQETCLFDWQNLIAQSARIGCQDEEELQWDSYEILNKRLQQEWLDSIEYRKTKPRPIGSKRAPKSLEQRRKIAEAIAAKWADPEYRSRVCTGLAKYHGIPEDAVRKERKRPSGEGRSARTSKKKRSDQERSAANEMKMSTQLSKSKKRNAPKYKDPLADSKLEMLKSIRAQRLTSETKNEALERAKILIAEAQKAAKALEVAAVRNPVARASLIEAEKLIAEATQSIESIKNGEVTSKDTAASNYRNYIDDSGDPLMDESEHRHHVVVIGTDETLTEDEDQKYHTRVNGVRESFTVKTEHSHHKSVNGIESLHPLKGLDTDFQEATMLDETQFTEFDVDNFMKKLDSTGRFDWEHTELNGQLRLNGVSSINGVKLQNHQKLSPFADKTVGKKWVRGRLVEVVEGE